MNVLITGAGGFVGRVLAPALAGAGHRVVATSRNPQTEISGATVKTVGGLGPETDWRQALQGIEAVVHLAARVHVMRERAADPQAENRRINTQGTRKLAEAAAAAGVRRFVFLSTIKVNGEQTLGEPFSDRDAAAPKDPYAIAKHEAEQALREISADSGMAAVILRPPLVYGPGVRGNFAALLRLCSTGWPLPLASINNRRSLIYVGNLADAIRTVLESSAAAGKTYLVRDGEDVSMPGLVRKISTALDRAGIPGRRPLLLPIPPGVLRGAAALAGKSATASRMFGDLCVDDGAIRRDLGWTPPFSMVQGLKETAAWFASARKSGN